VQVDALDTGPAEIVRDPGGIDPFCERLDLPYIFDVQRIRGAYRKRDAMQCHRVVSADSIEKV
jgi:hypothetical protein